jgi:hypothetical protein
MKIEFIERYILIFRALVLSFPIEACFLSLCYFKDSSPEPSLSQYPFLKNLQKRGPMSSDCNTNFFEKKKRISFVTNSDKRREKLSISRAKQ